MNSSILNNAYIIGVGQKDLVIQTLGRVYLKINDKYTELEFKDKSNNTIRPDESDIIIINSIKDLNSLPFPGNNKLIISLTGEIFITNNGEVIKWNLNQDLNLQDLIIDGQLTINVDEGISPIILKYPTLIENLNTQYLNGYTELDFAIKNLNEIIEGQWSFNNNVIMTSISSYDGKTVLDLQNSILYIDKIYERNAEESSDTSINNWLVNGTNDQLWVGPKVIIKEDVVEELYNYYNNVFEEIQFAIELDYLNYNNPQFWYYIFISNYIDGAENDYNFIPIIRNLSNFLEINYVNTLLSQNNLNTIDSYISVFYNIYINNIDFNGSVFRIPYNWLENKLPYGKFNVNGVVKFGRTSIFTGIITKIDTEYLYVKTKEIDNINTSDFIKGDNIIMVSRNINSPQICLDSINNPLLSVISKNDNFIFQVGSLNNNNHDIFNIPNNGLLMFGKKVNFVNNDLTTQIILNSLTNQSGCYTQYLNIYNNSDLISATGHGSLSNGKILWSPDVLKILNALAVNINIDKSLIRNSNINDSDADNLNINNSTANSININNSIIEQTQINDSSIDESLIFNSRIESTNVNNGTIENSWIENSVINDATVNDPIINNPIIDTGEIKRMNITDSDITNNTEIYKFNKDGSGQIAKGKIEWDSEGIITNFPGQTSPIINDKSIEYKHIQPDALPTGIFRTLIAAKKDYSLNDCHAALAISTERFPFYRDLETTSWHAKRVPFEVYEDLKNSHLLGGTPHSLLTSNLDFWPGSIAPTHIYSTFCPFIPVRNEDIYTQLILHLPSAVTVNWQNAAGVDAKWLATININVYGYKYSQTLIFKPMMYVYFDVKIPKEATTIGNKNYILIDYFIDKFI